MAPATAEPITSAGMVRNGSRAAYGMAPSVTKASPSTPAAVAEPRSSAVKRLRNTQVASAMPSGGVMPATMAAAIGV